MTVQPATVDSLRTLHAAAQRRRAGCAREATIHATIRAAFQAARLRLATPASEARRVAQLKLDGLRKRLVIR